MKSLRKKLLIMVLVLFSGTVIPSPSYAQNGYYDNGSGSGYGDISFQTFYDELYPYGEWINDAQYGYVWRPDVDYNFRPYYTNGRWVMTEYGNTWVSDYAWGWAAFHYGRWTYDSYYGWLWIPDYQWGPAWVSWRNGGGYYGWAPMSPGMGINSSFGYNYPIDWWIFIPYQYIYYNSYYNYYRGPRYNSGIYGRTSVIRNTYRYNNYTYVCGPSRSNVQRYSGKTVNVYRINTVNGPRPTQISGNNVTIYRPRVTAGNNGSYAPRSVVSDRNIGKPQSIGSNNGRPAFVPQRAANSQAQPPNGGNAPSRNMQGATREQPMQQDQQNRGVQRGQYQQDLQGQRNVQPQTTPQDQNGQRQQQQDLRGELQRQQVMQQQAQQDQQRAQQQQLRQQQIDQQRVQQQADQQRAQQQQLRQQQIEQQRVQQQADQQRAQQQQLRQQQIEQQRAQQQQQQQMEQQRAQQQQMQEQQRAQQQQMQQQRQQQMEQQRAQQQQMQEQQRAQQQQMQQQQRQQQEQQRRQEAAPQREAAPEGTDGRR